MHILPSSALLPPNPTTQPNPSLPTYTNQQNPLSTSKPPQNSKPPPIASKILPENSTNSNPPQRTLCTPFSAKEAAPLLHERDYSTTTRSHAIATTSTLDNGREAGFNCARSLEDLRRGERSNKPVSDAPGRQLCRSCQSDCCSSASLSDGNLE